MVSRSLAFDYSPATRRIATFTKESKIFKDTFHYANPIMYSFDELHKMAEWCYHTFGPPGYDVNDMITVWDYHSDPDYIFWFSDEKNLMFFVLRWS